MKVAAKLGWLVDAVCAVPDIQKHAECGRIARELMVACKAFESTREISLEITDPELYRAVVARLVIRTIS